MLNGPELPAFLSRNRRFTTVNGHTTDSLCLMLSKNMKFPTASIKSETGASQPVVHKRNRFVYLFAIIFRQGNSYIISIARVLISSRSTVIPNQLIDLSESEVRQQWACRSTLW